MKNVDLKKLNDNISQFVTERDWDQFHSLKNLTMALSVETSELLEIFQWLKEDESNQVKNNAKLMGEIEDEVADIFVYLLRIISKTDINLEEVVLNKLKKNALKYPVHLAKGSAKKYDQY